MLFKRAEKKRRGDEVKHWEDFGELTTDIRLVLRSADTGAGKFIKTSKSWSQLTIPIKMQSSPLLVDGDAKVLCTERKYCDKDNFLKSAIFSPDGSSVLASTEGNDVNMYNLHSFGVDYYKYYQDASAIRSYVEDDGPFCIHQSTIPIGESIYDMKWFPGMNRQDSGTNCFITTARDHPITLWDTESGSIRATYSGINHLDELDPAISLTFNLAGDKIYAGSNKMIRFVICFLIFLCLITLQVFRPVAARQGLDRHPHHQVQEVALRPEGHHLLAELQPGLLGGVCGGVLL